MPICGHGKAPGCDEFEAYYNTEREKINESVTKIEEDINKIIGDLNTLVIPEDYLGDKVKEQLKDICSSFEADKAKIVSDSNVIYNEIDGFIKVHNNHERQYQAYKASLEREKENSQQANDA